MKLPSIKRNIWYLMVIFLICMTLASIIILHPFAKDEKTAVEPLRFLGSYQMDDGTPLRLLTDSTYIDACDNDSVILHGTFSPPPKKNTQVSFYMEYLEVHIYLNNEEIYRWGTEDSYPSFMGSAGAGWGHCVLPADISPEDRITISLESKYPNNYNSAYRDFLDSLQTGDSGALAWTLLEKSWPYLLTGLLMFLVGLILQLFILSLAWQGVTIHPSIYFFALFSLSASIWVLMDPEYITLIVGNSLVVMLLETISMWLFSIFLCAYFGTFMQTGAKRINDLLLFGFVFTLIMFLVLQLFGVTDAYAIREFHNIFLCVAVVVFLFIYRYELKHAKQSEMRTLALPGLLYIIFGIIEVANYKFEWFMRGQALTFGFAIFIIVQFVFAVRQIRKSIVMALQAVALEKDLIESRTAVMLSQIRPHFLYNSLLGIKELCDTEPEKASGALEHFAYYLRGNMHSLSEIKPVPFKKEAAHVQDYLYLEKMRFEERLIICWDIGFTDFLLPSLTLQPIVENAVRHGITKRDEGGTLTIRSELRENTVLLTVTDDGVGFDVLAATEDSRPHIGLDNVRRRLQAQCGGTLTIHSTPGEGTEVIIALPGKEEVHEDYSSG